MVVALTMQMCSCFVQGMKTLIGTILHSSDHTFSILYVILMLVFVCASFAYVYWNGQLSYRCMRVEVSPPDSTPDEC